MAGSLQVEDPPDYITLHYITLHYITQCAVGTGLWFHQLSFQNKHSNGASQTLNFTPLAVYLSFNKRCFFESIVGETVIKSPCILYNIL